MKAIDSAAIAADIAARADAVEVKRRQTLTLIEEQAVLNLVRHKSQTRSPRVKRWSWSTASFESINWTFIEIDEVLDDVVTLTASIAAVLPEWSDESEWNGETIKLGCERSVTWYLQDSVDGVQWFNLDSGIVQVTNPSQVVRVTTAMGTRARFALQTGEVWIRFGTRSSPDVKLERLGATPPVESISIEVVLRTI